VIELDQDEFDLLMECAVTHALLVSDGTVAAVQRVLKDRGADLSVTARRVIGGKIVEGPYHERDQESWRKVLRDLQPRRA
jgi:hypothetical protein